MMRFFSVLVISVGMVTSAQAQDQLRVLVAPYHQENTLSRSEYDLNNDVFEQVGDFLFANNYQLFEFERGNGEIPRLKTVLYDVKQKSVDDFDVLIALTSSHRQKDMPRQIRDRLVLEAVLFDAKTLDKIAHVEIKSPFAFIERGYCSRECEDLILARHLDETLRSFQNEIAFRLDEFKQSIKPSHVVHPIHSKAKGQVTLTLKGFAEQEELLFENLLVSQSNTKDLSSLVSSEGKPAYWWERFDQQSAAIDELNNVLERMSISARFIETENNVIVTKIANIQQTADTTY